MKAYQKIKTDMFITVTRPLVDMETSFLINMKKNLNFLLKEETGLTGLADAVMRLTWMQEIDDINHELTLRN